jgi:group I intron endonuclease
MSEKKLNPVIYKTTNLINGKIYVGQDRYNKVGYLGSGTLLRSSINKHGKENFKKEILEFCSLDELNDKEIYWVTFYDSMNPKVGYNLTSGGKQNSIFSESSKNKMSISAKNKPPVSINTRHKQSISAKGKTFSIETVNKIQKKKKENNTCKHTEITKNKIRTSLKLLYDSNSIEPYWIGKSHSNETKQKIRDKRALQDMSKLTGKKRTQESKDKMSAARKKYWEGIKN